MDEKLQTLKAKLNEIRYELNEHRRYNDPNASANSARDHADRVLATGRFDTVTDALSTVLAEVSATGFGFNTPEYLAFERKDREIIDRYNAVVREYNGIVQAKKNARETAKIRAAMCNQCFTVHRPEVECY